MAISANTRRSAQLRETAQSQPTSLYSTKGFAASSKPRISSARQQPSCSQPKPIQKALLPQLPTGIEASFDEEGQRGDSDVEDELDLTAAGFHDDDLPEEEDGDGEEGGEEGGIYAEEDAEEDGADAEEDDEEEGVADDEEEEEDIDMVDIDDDEHFDIDGEKPIDYTTNAWGSDMEEVVVSQRRAPRVQQAVGPKSSAPTRKASNLRTETSQAHSSRTERGNNGKFRAAALDAPNPSPPKDLYDYLTLLSPPKKRYEGTVESHRKAMQSEAQDELNYQTMKEASTKSTGGSQGRKHGRALTDDDQAVRDLAKSKQVRTTVSKKRAPAPSQQAQKLPADQDEGTSDTDGKPHDVLDDRAAKLRSKKGKPDPKALLQYSKPKATTEIEVIELSDSSESREAESSTSQKDKTKLGYYDVDTKTFLQKGKHIFALLLVSKDAFPDTSTGIQFFRLAWAGARSQTGLNITATQGTRRVIMDNASNFRGKAKIWARTLVEAQYSLDDLAQEQIIVRVEALLRDGNLSFSTYDQDGKTKRAGVFRHTCISKVLQATLFNGPDSFAAADAKFFNPMPLASIGLACTAIHCALKEWKLGRFSSQVFDGPSYTSVYHKYMASIRDHAQRNPKSMREIQEHLYKVCRKRANLDERFDESNTNSFIQDDDE